MKYHVAWGGEKSTIVLTDAPASLETYVFETFAEAKAALLVGLGVWKEAYDKAYADALALKEEDILSEDEMNEPAPLGTSPDEKWGV